MTGGRCNLAFYDFRRSVWPDGCICPAGTAAGNRWLIVATPPDNYESPSLRRREGLFVGKTWGPRKIAALLDLPRSSSAEL